MDAKKRKRLEAAGWRVGSADQFLELSAAESALVSIRLALSDALKAARSAAHLSQQALAERLGSSQSRVAKMEAGDAEVSLDLLVRGLLVAGATTADLARAVGSVRTVDAHQRTRRAKKVIAKSGSKGHARSRAVAHG